ncbi:uncharacterized protein LOC127749697 [Frankliniella occidentalis]|uniref:Uncharacterized protein LOC127749697 n=1 Tax=Frankliniella occidentalis TaxID=133901 RepID=A0A9C6U2F3_FRAOC|nr:uncharacterized protein LOC127749697 [Frankliniella occidentalis]
MPSHMLAIHAMPRLKRLQIMGAGLRTMGLVLPELPPGHCGLQWLRVDAVSGDTLKSLLRAHAASLVELHLVAASATGDRDIESLALKKCGLPALRRVVLEKACYLNRGVCPEQLAAMRRMLPDTQVLCQSCDNVEREPF